MNEKEALRDLESFANSGELPKSMADAIHIVIDNLRELQNEKIRKISVCNMCGESTILALEPVVDIGGLDNCEVIGGYFSSALEDCSKYKFSICEFCLDYLFERFKIPPKIFCTIDGDYRKFTTAKERFQTSNQKKLATEFFEEYEKRNKVRTMK